MAAIVARNIMLSCLASCNQFNWLQLRCGELKLTEPNAEANQMHAMTLSTDIPRTQRCSAALTELPPSPLSALEDFPGIQLPPLLP